MGASNVSVADTLAADDSDLHGAIVESSILQIPTDLVDVEEATRLRPVSAAHVEWLAGSMAKEGQIVPIHVCRLPGRTRYQLVAGNHRFEAVKAAGIEFVRAELVGAGWYKRRIIEIFENLGRRDLDPLERAESLAELVAIKKAQAGLAPDVDGRKASAKARWGDAKSLKKGAKEDADDANSTMELAYGWTAEVSAESGLAKTSIWRLMQILRGIDPALIARLRDRNHPALKVQSELLKLSQMDRATQQRAVDMLIADPALKVTSAAKAIANRPVQSPEDKRFSTIIGTLRRMSTKERGGLVASPIFHSLLPADARRLLAPMLGDEEGDA